MPTSPCPDRAFPDKKKECSKNGRYNFSTPTGRPSGQMLAQRMRSISGYSSGEESPSSFRRVTSFGSTTDSCTSIQFVVGTPKAECQGSEATNDSWDAPSREALIEMSKEAGNEVRPPSPRPLDSRGKFFEHNKQLHIWDDWLTTTSPAIDKEFVPVRYRRTESKNAPKALPKKIDPDIVNSSEESDS